MRGDELLDNGDGGAGVTGVTGGFLEVCSSLSGVEREITSEQQNEPEWRTSSET